MIAVAVQQESIDGILLKLGSFQKAESLLGSLHFVSLVALIIRFQFI